MLRSTFPITRYFCSAATLNWNKGTDVIAKRLFQLYTQDVDDGPRTDPRGMRVFQLKKKLEGIPEFKDDLSKVSEFHPEIVKAWQKYYNDFMNGNVKLPGRDPAGPLTFHHECDKENVRLLYDKHGRVDH